MTESHDPVPSYGALQPLLEGQLTIDDITPEHADDAAARSGEERL